MEGQRLELVVENVAHGGHCVARHEGRVVFVRHAIPGERVVVRVTDGTSESKFLRADAIEILEPSADRVTPPCPYAGPGQCGGCDFQHVAVSRQRELKADVIRDQFARLAKKDLSAEGFEVTVEPVAGDADGLRWRTRLELGVRDGVAGLRAHRSHRLIDIDDCLIADTEFKPVLTDRFSPTATGLDIVAPSAGDIVAMELPLDAADEVPVVSETVRVGERTHNFSVAANGFWQVHPGAASTFATAVRDAAAAQPGETVLDLYCGVGLFAKVLADEVGPEGRVIGVEADETAIRLARDNMGGAAHVDLVTGDVASVDWTSSSADVVVLDPPRAGAGIGVMERVTQCGPRVIVYVACDPAALARDVKAAESHGYQLTSLRAFDAFPMTQHVECVAVLTPSDASTEAK